MADERITQWATALLATQGHALARARRRFAKRPSSKRLNDLHLAARRLGVLLEDFASLLPRGRHKRFHRMIERVNDGDDAAETTAIKARHIDLSDAVGIDEAMRRIAIVRFAELLTVVPALQSQRSRDLHAVRIACKRLRYALEGFTPREPALFEAASRLAQIQDALGEDERDAALARARALWRDGFAPYGPFAGLIRFTGLGHAMHG